MDNNARTLLDRAKLMLDAKAVIENMDRIVSGIDKDLLRIYGPEADFVITVEDYEILRDFIHQQGETMAAVTAKLEAANERLSAVEKERNSALDQCTSLHAARAEQIERDARICKRYGSTYLAMHIRAQMDTIHKD